MDSLKGKLVKVLFFIVMINFFGHASWACLPKPVIVNLEKDVVIELDKNTPLFFQGTKSKPELLEVYDIAQKRVHLLQTDQNFSSVRGSDPGLKSFLAGFLSFLDSKKKNLIRLFMVKEDLDTLSFPLELDLKLKLEDKVFKIKLKYSKQMSKSRGGCGNVKISDQNS
jgi:hypothetical protein